jgi:hypothetical protein
MLNGEKRSRRGNEEELKSNSDITIANMPSCDIGNDAGSDLSTSRAAYAKEYANADEARARRIINSMLPSVDGSLQEQTAPATRAARPDMAAAYSEELKKRALLMSVGFCAVLR